MAFDKYILGILFFSLTQALWGLWLCQFCSKVSFFSAFQDYFDPIYMPSTSPEVCYSFYWECTAGRWMWPRKKAQLSVGTPEYLLGGSLLMTAGHIQPFSVPASCDRVGISPVVRPRRDLSANLLYTSGALRLGRAISWVQEQSKVSFDASEISQGTLPFLGSLFGENLSSKKSAFRRSPPLGMLCFSCSWKSDSSFRWGGWVAGCRGAAVLLYYQHVSHGTCQGVAGQCFGPSHPALILSCQSLLNQCLVFVLRTALAQAKGTSCLYAKGGAFRFYLTNKKLTFQTHLSFLMYSWQK